MARVTSGRSYPTDLEPFRVPAYRRYLSVATVTSLSQWVWTTALSWTVLQASGSALMVGLVNALMTLPLPFGAIPGGLLTDRLGPRTIMALALLGEAVCIGIAGLLALAGVLPVWVALALTLLFGVADSLWVVPSQVMVGRIVPPRAMASAIGMSMLTIGVGRIIGGPLGGALVGSFGAAGAMIPAAIGVAAAALTVLTLPRIEGLGGGAASVARTWRKARGGCAPRPARGRSWPWGAAAALCLWPYLGLLAVVVRDGLSGGAADLGLLTAAGGVGAILAAVTMGIVGRGIGRGRQLVLVMVVAGISPGRPWRVADPLAGLPRDDPARDDDRDAHGDEQSHHPVARAGLDARPCPGALRPRLLRVHARRVPWRGPPDRPRRGWTGPGRAGHRHRLVRGRGRAGRAAYLALDIDAAIATHPVPAQPPAVAPLSSPALPDTPAVQPVEGREPP